MEAQDESCLVEDRFFLRYKTSSRVGNLNIFKKDVSDFISETSFFIFLRRSLQKYCLKRRLVLHRQ